MQQIKAMFAERQALKNLESSEDGFTLVEMAISLAIIGVLIAGILYAEELYRIVQVRRVMADINSISAATKGFAEKYGSIPGDFPLAQSRIGNCSVAISNCYNGNGDGFVGRVYSGSSGWDKDQAGTNAMPEVETAMFFKHLALGHFLKGIDPNADPTKPRWGYTHPEAATGGGFTLFADTNSAGSGISIRIQNIPYYNGATAIDKAQQRPYTVKQAKYMDEKYDDGRANAGNMWGIPYAGPADPACRKSWSGSKGEEYNMDPADAVADSKVCQFHFIFH